MVLANSTCLCGRGSAVVLGEEIATAGQYAVERRAQLVRHVGQELGLVGADRRQLGRLLLESQPRFVELLCCSALKRSALGLELRSPGWSARWLVSRNSSCCASSSSLVGPQLLLLLRRAAPGLALASPPAGCSGSPARASATSMRDDQALLGQRLQNLGLPRADQGVKMRQLEDAARPPEVPQREQHDCAWARLSPSPDRTRR